LKNIQPVKGDLLESQIIEGLFYKDKQPVRIEIKDGLIQKIIRPSTTSKTSFIAPGLIDIQVNGYQGVGFTENDLTINKVKNMIRALRQQGITSFLPTFITASPEILLKNLKLMSQALEDPVIHRAVPGFHMEGPYISDMDGPRGAHDQRWINNPDWAQFSKFQKAANDKILLITLAPEKVKAIDMIKKCREQGIVVSLGHHNASSLVIEAAIKAGATLATHLGNGGLVEMNRHHNYLWPQLAADDLSASIIADGFHLSPEVMQVFYKAKGAERLILISDITYLSGKPEGVYNWLGQIIEIHANGMINLLNRDVLAGASLPLIKGISNMVKYTSCSFSQAIDMASDNPAQLLGIKDRGRIEEGKRADLIVFHIEKNELMIQQTMVAGKWCYSHLNS
jgi:N-acetylglucosamine-6-phosphate deacetylase